MPGAHRSGPLAGRGGLRRGQMGGDGSARGSRREAHPGERNGQVILLQVQRARDRLRGAVGDQLGRRWGRVTASPAQAPAPAGGALRPAEVFPPLPSVRTRLAPPPPQSRPTRPGALGERGREHPGNSCCD